MGPDYVVHRLGEDNLSSLYPKATLDLLDILIDSHAQWPPHNLEKCLNDIKTADPALEEDGRYRRLTELQRRYE